MKKLSISIIICFAFFIAFSHEYILLAEKYRVEKGDELQLHLFVADGFNIELERPFQKTPTKSFELITADGITDLSQTTDGTYPIIKRKVDFERGGLIHLERDYARITLGTPKFLDYLKEDHIENIPSKVDRKKAEQKERYTRYIKCLVQSGNNFNDTLYKKVVGQQFEIVLLQNPYNLSTGKTLQAKILLDGMPLTNKVITARNRTGNEAAIALKSRTNEQGICSFVLSRKGEWFIHATHMIECPDKSDSDWESFWASYSFEVER